MDYAVLPQQYEKDLSLVNWANDIRKEVLPAGGKTSFDVQYDTPT